MEFPIKGLDVSEFAPRAKERPAVYDLFAGASQPLPACPVQRAFAVANHSGGLGGGHYTACAKVCPLAGECERILEPTADGSRAAGRPGFLVQFQRLTGVACE